MVIDTYDISKIVRYKSQQDNQITNTQSTMYVNDKLNEIQRNIIIVQKKPNWAEDILVSIFMS